MSAWLALGLALWFGVLTSISPCPLATNIAAISFIGRRVGQTRQVLLSGLLYTLGRTIAYVVLGVVLLMVLKHNEGAGSTISRFLQQYMIQILGPVLIIVGMLLLGLLSYSKSLTLAGSGVQQKVATGGAGWAFLLGILFALSFCPISAGLFFGSLLGLSRQTDSLVGLPTLFGIGTALPVLFFALLIAFGSQYVGKAFNRLTQIERWVRTVTGVLFILVGLYYCLKYVYGMSLAI